MKRHEYSVQIQITVSRGNIAKILADYSFSGIETVKSENLFTYLNLGTCQKLAAGRRGGNRGRVTTFWDLEKGGVMKNGRVMQIYARDHVEIQPKKIKEVIYLVKKKRKNNNNGTLWI